MPHFDLPLDELRRYAPDLPSPPDLEAFWTDTLRDVQAGALASTFEPVENGLTVIDTLDVRFNGFGGTPIHAWLHLPATRQEPLPAIIEYVGYGGGRGLAHERNLWAQAGYAHLVMDTRGQGSSWSVGETPDAQATGEPAHPGFMTQGVLDPETYYYRRVFADAVRAVEAVRGHPAVDGARIAVTGGSQGGGISLAVAGLAGLAPVGAGHPLAAVAADVPFLCDFPRATTLVDTDPYAEIGRYLKTHRDHVDRVFRTLSYFDAAILGGHAVAPALFSVGLMDETCPPSTVYAAYNAYSGPKEIREYAFNDHEGGQAFQDVERMRWFGKLLGR